MHAYLIISKNPNFLKDDFGKISGILNSEILEFELQRIEDAKRLKSFIKYSFVKPTSILVKNFHTATEETSNAILKFIEEPPENLTIIIHSVSENSISKTIRSRCQIVYSTSDNNSNNNSESPVLPFSKMSIFEKWNYLSKIKDRTEAIIFSEELIRFYQDKAKTADPTFIKNAISSLKLNRNLNMNGNLQLQFLRFLCNISN